MTTTVGNVPFENIIQSPEIDFSKPIDSSAVKEKTILVTGGASGLGAGFFTAWAALGANVIIGDISEDSGRRLVEAPLDVRPRWLIAHELASPHRSRVQCSLGDRSNCTSQDTPDAASCEGQGSP